MNTAAPLTTQQQEQFDQDGYTILRQVLSPAEVEGAREAMQELVDREAHKLLQQGLISNLMEDEPFETRFLRLYQNHLDKAPDYRPELHLAGLFPLFFNSKVLDIVEILLGSEIRLYPNYTARPKLPQHAKTLVLWHQDGGYTEFNSPEAANKDVSQMRMVNVWSPLVPVNRHNGCMQFVPGTHRLGVVPHEEKQYYLEIAREYLKPREADAVDVELEPGDIVLFHNLLFHRGLPNLSQGIRWSLDWRYQDATQETLRKEQGHLARSSESPANVISTAQDWANASFG
jgi:phytanoyl-CoA hydroxylase